MLIHFFDLGKTYHNTTREGEDIQQTCRRVLRIYQKFWRIPEKTHRLETDGNGNPQWRQAAKNCIEKWMANGTRELRHYHRIIWQKIMYKFVWNTCRILHALVSIAQPRQAQSAAYIAHCQVHAAAILQPGPRLSRHSDIPWQFPDNVRHSCPC